MKRTAVTATAAVGLVLAGAATPAWAYWSNTVQSSNANGYAQAVKVTGAPGVAIALRNDTTKKVTFTVTLGSSSTGYAVTWKGNPVCTVAAGSGSCTSTDAFSGNKDFVIAAGLGTWTASGSVTCSFVNENVNLAVCL